MIKKFLGSFVDDVFQELNSVFDEEISINKVRTETEFVNLPFSDTDINYQMFISSSNWIQDENQMGHEVKVRVGLIFQIPDKDAEVYERLFDRYVWSLIRIFTGNFVFTWSDSEYPSFDITNISECGVQGGEDFEGIYYRPNIEVTFVIMDDNSSLNSNNVHKSVSV